MRYIDRNTDRKRVPDDVGPLLRGMLANRQIRYEGQDEPPFVTDALKYEREPQARRQTSEYTDGNPFVESIIDVFGFDPLDFQVNSWETVDYLDEQRHADGESKAAVFSAPTGFGKTEAFLGPLYQLLREDRQESIAIVYPRRALLQDQLGRILEHIHTIKTDHDDTLSVGCYVGNMPWERSDVGNKGFFESTGGRPRFTLCNCWCGEDGESHSFRLHGTSESYVLRCENDPSHEFTDRELILSRKDLALNGNADIVLTTLESLENFAHKPHYSLVDRFDTIVLDEVHLYTGLRGAHAAKVIQNVDDISDDPLLWLGSSATIDDPKRFGGQIFGRSPADVETTSPPPSDYDDDHDDFEHYYFMLAPEDGPGVSSMALQQSMLLGHTMLEDGEGRRSKQLSFIDSISQINQQRVQLDDADRKNELWQFHRDNDEEDWDGVASDMDHRFIDEPLSLMSVYSEQGFDSETAANSDILLSTNFLEVGIDVGDIKIITQHRTPWNLSSFLQRAGRAARKPGMDSHIAVYLSNLTGDANMFYRADRFLGSDIRTPLNTDNRVVEWMHDRFNRYYDHVSWLDDQFIRFDEHRTFLERYLQTDLGYDSFYEMLVDPRSFFEEEFGIDVPSEPMLSKPVVADVQDALDSYLEAQHETVADVEEYFGMEDGEIVRGTDAVGQYVLEVQEQTLLVIKTFDGQVSGYEQRLASRGGSGYEDLVQELNQQLAEAKNRAQVVPSGGTHDVVTHFSSLLADLFGLTGKLMQLRNRVNSVVDEAIAPVNQGRLADLNDAVTQLETLSEDERIEDYYRLEKQVHYVRETLDQYASYLDGSDKPYNSLYKIKDLLRAAYYFDLYLQTEGRQLDDEVWFVPPSYFDSSGQFVSVFREDQQTDRPEESIDSVVTTYAPYRSEYQSQSGVMHAFLPKTTVTDDGVVMDYKADVTGEKHEDVLVPDTLQLSEMTDISEEKALEMVQYCPVCFQVIPGNLDRCLRHEEREYGKIHSEPHVDTSVIERTPVESTGDLTLADLEAKVSLESVTLEITPGKFYGPDIGVSYDKDQDRFTQELESPEMPLGFTTRTRGLVYDLTPFLDGLEENVGEYVRRYKDLETGDLEHLAYHTAAHFFLQLVADISSVNSQRVFYGFDQDEGEVYVFERTEGGQGIVDLVYDELDTDPGSVLESINRLAYNEQVISERLWASSEFVADLPTATTDTESIRPIIESHLGVPFETVVDRVTEEIISTIDRAQQFATDEDISTGDAYSLKHVVASAQVAGEEFPADAIATHETSLSDVDRVETAFHSPDIDGCVENLHLTECIEAGDQSETLSYVVLEALRAHLTESVPTEEATETMFDRERPPGGEIDGTSVFLDF
ncbi:Type III restriction enzyme, res subunit [Halomicrobium zhouii]|uniref:Type III restriction enzyme, res subunit n=2 Tax=Halomicrobium zhouii TaxID=767519 RepID=A0A1I6L147_9EURY|nr:Type III restriction enzyme, res subunit [Halomicrobium zhouii]